jgi:hypothetical protein
MVFALDELPPGCRPATSGLEEFESQATLPPGDLVAYFRANPQTAKQLAQSYYKRYIPSTLIEEVDGGYQVGWYDHVRKYLQHFTDFSEVAADYLLFSFGRRRLRCQTI